VNNTQLIEERLQRLGAGPDDGDWDAVVRRAGETPERARRVMTRWRIGLASVAVCIAAGVAVAFSGLLDSAGRSAPQAAPQQLVPITLKFTRDDAGTITSIDATVRAATRGGTALLQVVRGEPGAPKSQRQIVFSEHVPMTNVAPPKKNRPGAAARSTWSGTLSPGDWNGRCENATYVVDIKVSPAIPTTEAHGEAAESGSFNCSPG